MIQKLKAIDVVQVVGFGLSIIVSIGLLIAGKETVSSISLGLIVAVFTQLIDLQVRQDRAEQRLVEAYELSRALYDDEWLFGHVREISDAYLKVKDGWFDLYELRARTEIVDCRNLVHSLAEGKMTAYPPGPFSFGKAFETAESSIKHVSALVDVSYWKTTYAKTGLQWNSKVIGKGVSFIRIYTQPLEILSEIVDILEQQVSIGIEVYVVMPGEMPENRRKDFIVVDDRSAARQLADTSGGLQEQQITIDPIEVERLANEFHYIKYHAVKFQDVVAQLK